MSHIHIPDGILPVWLVALGWVATAILLTICVRKTASATDRRRVPLIGAVGALMLVGMSSEIVPIAYHINLTVVAGILLGPWLSPIAAIVVVTMLALVGHGGVTVIGLNTLVISTEMVLGQAIFKVLVRALGLRRAGWSAAVATVLALAISTTALVGIVALAGAPATARETGAFNPASMSFGSLLGEGLAGNVFLGGEEETAPRATSVARFAVMVFTLGLIGWILEAIISALIIGFIGRVRPALLEGALSAENTAPAGDEGVHR
jgi:cobalt/nickel transport system permease protein